MIRISVGEYFLNILLNIFEWRHHHWSAAVLRTVQGNIGTTLLECYFLLNSIENPVEFKISPSLPFLTAMMNVTFLFLFWQLEYKYNRESVHGEKEEVWVLLTISVHTPDMSLHKGKENNRQARSNLETFRAVNIKSCNVWSIENQTLTTWSVENQCFKSWSVESQSLVCSIDQARFWSGSGSQLILCWRAENIEVWDFVLKH